MSNFVEKKNILRAKDFKDTNSIKTYLFSSFEEQEYGTDSKNNNQTSMSQPMSQMNISQDSSQTSNISEEKLNEIKNEQKEGMQKFLTQIESLSSSLQKLQEQFDKQQKEIESKVSVAKEEGRILGLKDGGEQTRALLSKEFEEKKEALEQSLQSISTFLTEFDNKIDTMEKDLSQVALDLAKEVLDSEISSNSAKIASNIATNLMGNIKNAQKIHIKLNPTDYQVLFTTLSLDSRVSLESDTNIRKGGVVISSDAGNLDGDIYNRFKILKDSILAK